MQIRIKREIINSVVQATLQVLNFDAQEQNAILSYGYPIISVGGSFSDSFTRSTETAPVLNVVGDGSGAEISAVINAETGIFESVSIENAGTGYTTATIVITGNSSGSGATFSTTLTDGALTSVDIITPGIDYVPDPLTVTFTLTDVAKLLTEDFLLTQNFAFSNSRNADLQAKIFTTDLEERISEAMTTLLTKQAEYLGITDKIL